nr:unnamed protein product [Digitaria exilis]
MASFRSTTLLSDQGEFVAYDDSSPLHGDIIVFVGVVLAQRPSDGSHPTSDERSARPPPLADARREVRPRCAGRVLCNDNAARTTHSFVSAMYVSPLFGYTTIGFLVT